MSTISPYLTRSLLVLALVCAGLGAAQAKLNVVATTPDIGAILQAVGSDDISLEVIAKGTQDAHTIEAKPSYMVKISKADLVVLNGLALEVGWLPSLIQGGRNPKVNPGSKGYLDLGAAAEPIEIPAGSVSRASGDVHPEGNPHFTLDPIRVGKAAIVVADRLGELDSVHKAAFTERAKAFQKDLEARTPKWQERINASGIKKVVGYHKTLNYFFSRFSLEPVAYMEPKPGIPPTIAHILEVIDLIKRNNVKLILHENIFESKYADRLHAEVPSVKVAVVGAAVDSKPELKTNADVYEQLVKAIESAK